MLLGVVTADAARQQAALRFMQWLLEPARLGRWSRAAGWLPTRPAAWDEWSRDDPYILFLRDALAAAPFIPSGPRYADARRQLRQAAGDVLTTETAAQSDPDTSSAGSTPSSRRGRGLLRR